MSSAKAFFRVVVDHRVAAVLHHDDLAVVLHQPRQGVGEGLGGADAVGLPGFRSPVSVVGS